ncbi:hypothetical protein DWQ67_12725 [Galactobacter caseinivorans]|uniref:SRPBCC domain-containing protein n=1 Tax=Galactobacter caseinivorans TaxID=2676123 RepID=A0A496PFD5_9MICC|nr:hypothetical protein DWQ67_12725 [Galactobacter caseinivorans]
MVSVELQIPGDAASAAEGFFDYLHLWWPVNLYSVSGSGAQLWWDQAGLLEDTERDERVQLGASLLWSPPQGAAVKMGVPGAEGDEWEVRIEDRGVAAHVTFTAPLPRHQPGQEAQPVPTDLWEQVMGFYARFMGAGKD